MSGYCTPKNDMNGVCVIEKRAKSSCTCNFKTGEGLSMNWVKNIK